MKLGKKLLSVVLIILFMGSSLIVYTSMFRSSSPPQYAVFETSMGTIEVQLDTQKAPLTSANFVQYVKIGFYNGTVFHRVMPGFVIQGGGYTVNGQYKQTNAPIKLENTGLSNTVGTIAMARTNDPDSATSQFYINLANNTFLDPSSQSAGYAVFGKVIAGMDVVKAIGEVKTGTRGSNMDWPLQDVVINGVYIKSTP
jgi:peptidyl-prolyl cis-trans isomerase B (cyclophilin B)